MAIQCQRLSILELCTSRPSRDQINKALQFVQAAEICIPQLVCYNYDHVGNRYHGSHVSHSHLGIVINCSNAMVLVVVTNGDTIQQFTTGSIFSA